MKYMLSLSKAKKSNAAVRLNASQKGANTRAVTIASYC